MRSGAHRGHGTPTGHPGKEEGADKAFRRSGRDAVKAFRETGVVVKQEVLCA
jgi:hypothetical protein